MPGFGNLNSKIAIIGLAPAAHGGTRTGRAFTGDKSGDFLFICLYKRHPEQTTTTTTTTTTFTFKGPLSFFLRTGMCGSRSEIGGPSRVDPQTLGP